MAYYEPIYTLLRAAPFWGFLAGLDPPSPLQTPNNGQTWPGFTTSPYPRFSHLFDLKIINDYEIRKDNVQAYLEIVSFYFFKFHMVPI
jgi:hypothetical protein